MGERLRVYELARELGLTSGELIELLEQEGVEVKSHASAIDGDIAEIVREHVIEAHRRRSRAQAEAAEAIVEAELDEEDLDDQADEDEDEDEDEFEDELGQKEIHLKPPVIVRDLADAIGRKPNELIGQLMTMNIFAAINQVVETEIVEQLCERNGFKFVRERRAKAKAKAVQRAAKKKAVARGVQKARPPVIAFLGHVDHGKTSLQDAVRETRVAAGEAGGITQHIGASTIVHNGHEITFLDTPGHEAFTAMRARGANATDIAVVVVAADDGVMPQTIEAINHAKAAGVSIVVAMNKMDLPGANPDKVLLGLQQNGVMSEDWGGDIGVVPVSAITKEGLDDLLERLLLEAEMLELKGSPAIPAEALVIEAQLEQGMGPTANILVRDGTLNVGDIMLCGPYYGRVKAMIDDHGKRVKKAGPSTPVKVLGLSGVPSAGEKLTACDDEREAKRIAQDRSDEARKGDLSVTRQANLEDLFRQMEEEARAELALIIKGDVRGTVEAIIDSLGKMESEKINLRIIHSGVGEITENDVLLAASSDAIIVGFHVRAMPGINRTAKAHGVEIRLYMVIYELLEDLHQALLGRLEPETRENELGKADILQIFNISRTGKICGCRASEGVIRVSAGARVFRDSELIYKGTILQLKHFQDEVREVRAGMECGIRLDNFEDFEVGDRVECFAVEQVAAKL